MKNQTVKRTSMRPIFWIATIASMVLLAGTAAQARVWTDNLNRTWEGDFVRVDGAIAVFLVKGKEYPFPIANLSAADQAFVSIAGARPPTPAAPGAPVAPLPPTKPTPTATPSVPAAPAAGAGALDFLGTTLVPGKTVQVDVKLPPDVAKASSGFYKKDTTMMKVGVAVPKDFDPSKPQRLLITSASSSGDGLSVKNMNSYVSVALERGWMVMATDGEFGKPAGNGDGTWFRNNMTEVLLDLVAEKWPKAKTTWSLAFGGFSGGAGYASYLAVTQTARGWPVTGIVLLNSSYNPLNWKGESKAHYSSEKMRKIPVLVSVGETDKVQTKESIEMTYAAMKRAGYKNLRMETHPGAHKMEAAHVRQALEWFESLEKETKGK